MSDLPDRTPLFNALQSERYGRRSDIQDIEGITGRKLIVYFAKPGAGIEQDDVLAFGDLLHDVSGQSIDLLLQSPGGDIDVAEKLVSLTASRCPSFRVIVAQSAKSAATLMALASDEIVMGDTSELGPIDPQVTVTTAQGQRMVRPASSFLDGLELIKRQVDEEGGELSPAFFPASGEPRPRAPRLLPEGHREVAALRGEVAASFPVRRRRQGRGDCEAIGGHQGVSFPRSHDRP